jgi:benzoate membrane transport protein
MRAAAISFAPSFARPWCWARQANSAVLSSGASATLLYLFGPVPLYLGAAAVLAPEGSSGLGGFTVAFAMAGLASMVLSLRYRQPIALGWSLPGLVYMTTVVGRYSPAEMAGAGVVTGLAIVALSLSGLTGRVSRSVPAPVLMGALAGSVLAYCTGAVAAVENSALPAGAAIAGFFAARSLGKSWMPPVAGAFVVAAPVLIVSGQLSGSSIGLGFETPLPLAPAFNPGAVLALTLPMLVIVMVGNVQGLAYLESEGYRPPRRAVHTAVGIVSVVQAVFGGPPGAMQKSALAVLAGPEAGPRPYRYLATVLASMGALVIAVFAVPVHGLVAALPPAFIAAIMGLILIAVVQDALQKAIGTGDATAGFVAFAVAAAGLSALGIEATFWALLAGWAVSRMPAPRPAAPAKASA